MKIHKIPEEILEQARHADLVEYLRLRGVSLKREGNEYRVLDIGGGLMVKGYKWHWWSADKAGKAVDYLIEFYGMTLQQAVSELLGCPVCPVVDEIPASCTNSQTCFQLPDRNSDNRRVIAYLCKSRKLDYSIISELLKQRLLYQDKHGNCCFVMRDWQGHSIGAELHGTGSTRFKQSTRHTCCGFHFSCGNQIAGAMFFESAIDLLSYYQIHRSSLTHHTLVSMAGLNDSAVLEYARHYPDRKICLCCDNGQAGDNFISRIRNQIADVYVHRPSACKDCNDCLRSR